MIEKINFLRSRTSNAEVQSLCERATSTINSAIYQNVPEDSRVEIEKAVIEDLFEKLSAIKDKEARKWLKDSKRIWAVRNLGVRESINRLMASEGKTNASLKGVLNSYKDLLSHEPEVMIYENFISALQSFSYFPQVGNEIKAIEDRINNYESDVSITKIMEMMRRTKSSYLVPLIEDLVQNYLDNKNIQSKSSLKEGLIKFSYDPFVRDIINLVTADSTNLQLEYANAQCDIEKVYSPILYLGENEAIFGVRGSYYIKKGNILSRLNRDSISRLDREFVDLCEAINSSDVVIDGNSIVIYEGSDKAIITENSIKINGKEFTKKSIEDSAEVSKWTGKQRFMSLVEKFYRNFNEIAEVDFAKRVFLKENSDYAADIFRLRGNISISTYDPMQGSGTFYRNINPIQAKNLMMEHLRFDVSKAFEDLLPAEEKINEEIQETKSSYEAYISDLSKKINEFKAEGYNKSVSSQVLGALEEELQEVENEYKDYLNLIETYRRLPKETLNEAKISLEIDGPLNIEVDGQKYVVPIPSLKGGEGAGEEASDAEFGTEVGSEFGEDPASAVTFDDSESEMLGDSPSIPSDEVNLGADKIEADVDAAEAEAEAESGDIPESPEEEMDLDDEGEIKVDDDDLDLDLGLDAEDEEEEKIEDSTSNSEAPTKKEDGEEKSKELKRKVFLKKKKS